jgi:hypothetical protein
MEARKASRVTAHDDRRRSALAGLATLDSLPGIHRIAAWLLAQNAVSGLSSGEAEFRAAIHRLTLNGDSVLLDVAEGAATVLATLIPPESEVDSDGVRLARGDECEIRVEAEFRARCGQKAQEVYELARASVPPKERACPGWWRRRLRRAAKKAQVWYDTALRLAKHGESPFVSQFTLDAYRQRRDNAAEWAAGQVVQFADGTEVPLPNIQARARKARRATTYAVLKGMEYYGDREGYSAFFITLTLPGKYHSVIKGEKAKDGSVLPPRPNPNWDAEHGPAAAWTALTDLWGQCRARLAKHKPLRSWFGISVPEPHHDGTPHLHALVWLPTSFESPATKRGKMLGGAGRRRSTALVLKDILHDLAPGPQSRLEIVRKRPDRTLPDGRVRQFLSPASYVMKYVTADALDDQDAVAEAGEAGERHRAWASSRCIRRMRLVGAHGSLRVWQRLWTSPDDEELPHRAALARSAMRRSAAAGERGATAELDSDERRAAREEQAAAAAKALEIIGAFPGSKTRFRLGYDDATTGYGRPTRRAARIEEHELVEDNDNRGCVKRIWAPTGDSFPLKRQTAILVSARLEAENSVTGMETVPSDVAALVAERERLPQWQDWCAERRAAGVVTVADIYPRAGDEVRDAASEVPEIEPGKQREELTRALPAAVGPPCGPGRPQGTDKLRLLEAA